MKIPITLLNTGLLAATVTLENMNRVALAAATPLAEIAGEPYNYEAEIAIPAGFVQGRLRFADGLGDVFREDFSVLDGLATSIAAIEAKTNTLGTGKVTVVSPVSPDGKTLNLTRGDDYYAADGRALEWEQSTWPELVNGTTVQLTVGDLFSVAGTVIAPRRVRVELGNVDTSKLPASDKLTPPFELLITLPSGHKLRPVIGKTLVSFGPTPA